MSDLISRSELLKRFSVNKDGHRIPERDCDNFEVTVSIKDVKTIIKEQPTAYDIGKVVEELEMEMKASSGYSAERVSAFSRAIEIVNQGGVSDDFCEWKMDNVGASIGCRSDLHHTSYVNRIYCPYCGKKIKVVG